MVKVVLFSRLFVIWTKVVPLSGNLVRQPAEACASPFDALDPKGRLWLPKTPTAYPSKL